METETVRCAFCGDEFEAIKDEKPDPKAVVIPVCDDCIDILLFELTECVKETYGNE